MDTNFAATVRTIAVALCLLLTACSLPDLQPFADATAELNTAMEASGKAVTEALRENEAESDRVEGKGQADRFATAFQARTQAMAAFVRYSDSLAAIAAAGERGAETAAQVGEAVNGLLTDVGAFVPGLPLVAPSVMGVISEGYALIAQIRAAQSMKKAVETADPIVRRLAFLIGGDLSDMIEIVELSGENSVERIQSCLAPHDPVGCQSVKRLTDLKAAYSKRAESAEAKLAQLANAGDTPSDQQVQSAREWRGLATEVDARLSQRTMLLAQAKQQTRIRLELLRNTEKGFTAWGELHSRLAVDLRQGTQPNARNLITATNSLRGLIEKVRGL